MAKKIPHQNQIHKARNQGMSAPQQNEEKQQSKSGPSLDVEIVPLAEMERQAIVDALLQVKGDKPEAARRLGIGKSTLYRKLKRYGLTQ